MTWRASATDHYTSTRVCGSKLWFSDHSIVYYMFHSELHRSGHTDCATIGRKLAGRYAVCPVGRACSIRAQRCQKRRSLKLIGNRMCYRSLCWSSAVHTALASQRAIFSKNPSMAALSGIILSARHAWLELARQ